MAQAPDCLVDVRVLLDRQFAVEIRLELASEETTGQETLWYVRASEIVGNMLYQLGKFENGFLGWR